ncbi:MAG: type IV pilus twitching motility protein PilT [Planctomycetes bacterium]|nr:type IV pilus twitching motility protein PilT [Planctomycetota bacterium]
MSIRTLLELMVKKEASDLHLKVGSPPGLRIHGELIPIDGMPPLTPRTAQDYCEELLGTDGQRETYEKNLEIDFSYAVEGLSRFRVNLFHQRGACGAVLRKIPFDIPPLDSMGFPGVVRELCAKPRGLVLVTGPTGSGKSTTLAAMIDHINRTEHGHILTLEDPIEFVHEDKKCFINQREIGVDSKSFGNALRSALREDPDVILVGEMRDLETIALAITAAETGHLVFGTLHTTSAIQTVDRIIDVFPHDAQQQIRMQLSVVLQGVISQTLLPKAGGGRCCAQEIMVGTDAVRSLIREGKTQQLSNVLQTGTQFGMQTLEMHLVKLVQQGLITADDACSKANSPPSVLAMLNRGSTVTGGAPSVAPTAAPVVEPLAAAKVAKLTTAPRPAADLDDFEKFRQQRRVESRP